MSTVIDIDERRPWPLGLPAAGLVLEGIAGQAEIVERLQSSHLHVLSMMPENLYEAARTNLAGTSDPVALAAASAWRALMATERIGFAIAVDQPALQKLIDEAVDAREKILAAGYFALDGGESAQDLLDALGLAVETLTVKAELKAAPQPVPRAKIQPTPRPSRPVAVKKSDTAMPELWKVLMLVAAVAVILFSGFQLVSGIKGPPPSGWVLVGDVEQRAFITRGEGEATDASLQAFIRELTAKGLTVTKTESGEWSVQR